MVCPFVLQAPEEPFGHRVVVTVNRSAVAGGDHPQSARVWNSASARTEPAGCESDLTAPNGVAVVADAVGMVSGCHALDVEARCVNFRETDQDRPSP
jgi:hypothetical protein